MLMCEQWSERGEGGWPIGACKCERRTKAVRPGTYSRSSLHREEWKIYIKPSEKSTTHPRGGGARTCVRFKRAVAALRRSAPLSTKPSDACSRDAPAASHTHTHTRALLDTSTRYDATRRLVQLNTESCRKRFSDVISDFSLAPRNSRGK